MFKQKPVYVELYINAKFSDLWEYTQNPEKQQQWDLRFSEITPISQEDETNGQLLEYRKNIAPGVNVIGRGKAKEARFEETGENSHTLTFWSDQLFSPIKSGSGLWIYGLNDSGFHFKTWFDYQTRFGLFGRFLDTILFRPLLGWATAWSFDCLRLWLEKNIHPKTSLRLYLAHMLIATFLAFAWIYQGLVPKMLYPETGELALLQNTGLFPGYERLILPYIGIGEIIFGLLFLLFRSKLLHFINCLALLGLAVGAIFHSPALYLAPFNPASLTIAMAGLSIVDWLIIDLLPTAGNCLRKPKEAYYESVSGEAADVI